LGPDTRSRKDLHGRPGADLVDCGPGIDTVKKEPYPGPDRFVNCEKFVD
jgi:hypothetical protein